VAINTEYQGVGNEDAMGHARKAVEEARAFKEAFASRASDFSKSVDLRGRVQRNPIGMVCAAAGIGYLLGGGLFSPTTGRLVRYGIRLALIPLLKSQIGAVLGGQESDGMPG
jgi:hypothetical protein